MMTLALRTLSLAALLALAGPGVLLAQVAASDDAPSAMVVNAEATFVRDAPNVRGAVVVRLERGDRVQVIERTPGDWWRVRAGDPPREGYVHRLVLSPYSATWAPRPPREVPPSTPQPTPAPAGGSAGDRGSTPAAKRPGPGMLVSGGAGLFFPAARDSFDAVGITGNPVTYGGTVEAVRVFRSLFVRGSVDWTSETGERVFLSDTGERYPLGIPLEIELMPIEFSAGWRFEGRSARRSPVVPYVGGGAGLLLYRETDQFAEGDDEVDERFASYHALAGVDLCFHRLIGARLEYRFRHVPDSLGDGGVSAVTGDTSLGGSVLFFGIVVGR